MAPRLPGQISIFGVVFSVSKSLLRIESLGAMLEYIERGLLRPY